MSALFERIMGGDTVFLGYSWITNKSIKTISIRKRGEPAGDFSGDILVYFKPVKVINGRHYDWGKK